MSLENNSELRLIDRIEQRLEGLDKKAERLMKVSEFVLIREDILQRQGHDEHSAFMQTRFEKAADKKAFEGRAIDLFDYRQRLTEGEFGISPATFQHSLDTIPQVVVEDSAKWADINRQLKSD